MSPISHQPLLAIDDLHISFPTPRGEVRAVRGISFQVEQGEIFGIVGESGCGKTVTGRSILGLVPQPGRITAGRVVFQGSNLTAMSQAELRHLRGNRIAMIFQDPSAALNPLFTIGQQLLGIMKRHDRHAAVATGPAALSPGKELYAGMRKTVGEKRGKRAAQLNAAISLLRDLGLPQPESLLDSYPHQLSGGMQQRAMIAMALAAEPDLIVADEPTTALDVTIQAQILDLLVELKEKRGVTIVFITHDLGVVAETCDHVAVFYLGQIVEQGTAREIFKAPRHPYTQGLLAALPSTDAPQEALKVIPGSVTDSAGDGVGCAFASRCEYRMAQCDRQMPQLIPLEGQQRVACFLYDEIGEKA